MQCVSFIAAVQARGVVFRCFLYLHILAPFKGVNLLAVWQNSSDVLSGRRESAVYRQKSVVLDL